MHRALAIPEIVFTICNAFVDDQGHVEGQGPYVVSDTRALAACARTSRAFHLPAVTALWKDKYLTIEDVAYYLLPASVWSVADQAITYKPFDCIGNRMALARAISVRDTERLVKYAPLMNALVFGGASSYSHRSHVRGYPRHKEGLLDLSDEGYYALSVLFPDNLFPNLRHIDWNDSSANLAHIRSFLGPPIVSIHLHIQKSPLSSLSIVPHLPLRCPHVQDFLYRLDASVVSQRRSHHEKLLLDAVSAWDLRAVETSIISEPILRHLSQCPSIHSVKYLLADHSRQWKAASLGHPNAFSSLYELFLHLIPMKFAIDFFQGCRFDHLRNVFVRVIRPGRGEWPSLLRAFRAAHRQPRVLLELQINEWTTTEESDRTPLSDADMEPLLTFPLLENLDLESAGGFDLSNETMERMAMAWPHMRNLRLWVKTPPAWTRRLTIDALASLARHCPALETLEIDFDATGITLARNPERPPLPPFLSSINVQWSPITSARVVAAYLSVIFPLLSDASMADEADEEMQKRWKRVGSSVALFRKIRQQERMDVLGQEPAMEDVVQDDDYESVSEDDPIDSD
ncbi:hypothetical protein EV121DRAFT_291793 [Schizophyllum commune]